MNLVDTLRNVVLGYCAKSNKSLIFTWVYGGAEDDEVLAEMVESIESKGGVVRFVELSAPDEVLLERVVNDSRRAHKKLRDRETLHNVLGGAAFGSIPYDGVLKIDTTNRSPSQTAREIASHFQL